jgi:hypothetical protein
MNRSSNELLTFGMAAAGAGMILRALFGSRADTKSD